MANKPLVDLKDVTELQKEMNMSSLKRALDDVEYNGCGIEPLKKRTCLPILKRHIRGSTSGKKAKVGARTHCRLPNTKKHFNKAPIKSCLKTTHTTTSQGSEYENKTDELIELDIKKKRSKRSADSLPNQITEESDIKKRKVDQAVTEADSENGKDSTKTTNDLNATDATSDTPQHTESPKLGSRFCGLAEYMKEGSKEQLLQQSYNFRKNVAFARQIVVYASDGSEYDYSDLDNAICDDNDDDDDDLYDDDDDDLDSDDDFEDVDPDAEVVSKRLNLQIADFFRLHRDREVKYVSKPQSGEVRPTELRLTSSFGMGLFYEPAVAGCSGVAAPPAVTFGHDENGNDAEELDRASAASNNLKPGIPW